KGLDITPYAEKLEEFGRTGVFLG
ncbi:MAG: hypothetical protein JWR83_2598, partial [Aeromicrobium sp.]|nr:hypothetical protein [Aeromicrobium sp.]